MDYSLTLLRAPLFRGIPREDLPGLLEGLDAREHRYGRGEAVLRRGERADRMGLVLSGTLHIVKEDFWGSRTIVGLARPGEVFAESYACLEGEPLEVSVLAAEAAEALFLNSGRTLPDAHQYMYRAAALPRAVFSCGFPPGYRLHRNLAACAIPLFITPDHVLSISLSAGGRLHTSKCPRQPTR